MENADAEKRKFLPAVIVDFTCDRCKRAGKGLCSTLPAPSPITAGYYDLTASWREYARGNEKTICDECMNSDEKFKTMLRSSYGFSV